MLVLVCEVHHRNYVKEVALDQVVQSRPIFMLHLHLEMGFKVLHNFDVQMD